VEYVRFIGEQMRDVTGNERASRAVQAADIPKFRVGGKHSRYAGSNVLKIKVGEMIKLSALSGDYPNIRGC
jgi:hypothetical protein